MKRRSLFAGLLAAFAPAVPVVAKPTSAPVAAFVDNVRAYQNLLHQKAEAHRQLAMAEAARADVYKSAYEDMAKAGMEGMNRLVKDAQKNLDRSRRIAELGISSSKLHV